jgi:hypothetical protein
MAWAMVAFLLCAVVIWSQGDPLRQHDPLLFFLAALSALSGLVSALMALLLGLLASRWRPPLEEGTGLSP